jgi:hypothetical protein
MVGHGVGSSAGDATKQLGSPISRRDLIHSACGPMLPTWALQQGGSYLGTPDVMPA